MSMDLEGQAVLDGGFVLRVESERVQLKMGLHTEYFPLAVVAALCSARLASVLASSGESAIRPAW